MPSTSKAVKASLPCRYLADHECAVYDDRPESCRAFTCALFNEVSSGRRDLASVLDEVISTRTVLESMATRLPPAEPGASFIRRLKDAASAVLADGSAPGIDPFVLVDYADYDVLRYRFLAAAD